MTATLVHVSETPRTGFHNGFDRHTVDSFLRGARTTQPTLAVARFLAGLPPHTEVTSNKIMQATGLGPSTVNRIAHKIVNRTDTLIREKQNDTWTFRTTAPAHTRPIPQQKEQRFMESGTGHKVGTIDAVREFAEKQGPGVWFTIEKVVAEYPAYTVNQVRNAVSVMRRNRQLHKRQLGRGAFEYCLPLDQKNRRPIPPIKPEPEPETPAVTEPPAVIADHDPMQALDLANLPVLEDEEWISLGIVPKGSTFMPPGTYEVAIEARRDGSTEPWIRRIASK